MIQKKARHGKENSGVRLMISQSPRQKRDLKRQVRGVAESSLTWEDPRVNGIQEFRKGIPVFRPKVGRRYWGRVFPSKARH